jgi:hypothetical protein
MIDTRLVEIAQLKEQYTYWRDYITESVNGKIGKATKLTRIKTRLEELNENSNSSYMLDEGSLSRIQRHIAGATATSWGMLSAERKGLSPQENAIRTAELKSKIREKGLGFVPMKGGWRECQDSDIPYNQCPPEKLVNTTENSFFVPNISRDDVHELGNAYQQDAIIYGGPDTKGFAQLVFGDGNVESIGKFNAENMDTVLSQGYSRMRNGRQFVFREKPTTPEPVGAAKTPAAKTPDATNAIAVQTMYNDLIVNPKTGKQIKLRSALRKNHPAYKIAIRYINSKLQKK